MKKKSRGGGKGGGERENMKRENTSPNPFPREKIKTAHEERENQHGTRCCWILGQGFSERDRKSVKNIIPFLAFLRASNKFFSITFFLEFFHFCPMSSSVSGPLGIILSGCILFPLRRRENKREGKWSLLRRNWAKYSLPLTRSRLAVFLRKALFVSHLFVLMRENTFSSFFLSFFLDLSIFLDSSLGFPSRVILRWLPVPQTLLSSSLQLYFVFF